MTVSSSHTKTNLKNCGAASTVSIPADTIHDVPEKGTELIVRIVAADPMTTGFEPRGHCA
jgi:hypothetical protein